MKEMNERIKQIRQESGLSIAEFAAKIGLASSSLQNIENGRINPSLEVILKIDSNCPQYGLNWLLYGKPMKTSGGVDIKNCHEPEDVSYKLPDTGLFSIQHPMESSSQFKVAEMALSVVIGTAVNGKVRMMDLAKAPHILIGGATRQGKSVLIHNLIVSLLLKKKPEELKFVMIDTNKVGLSCYEPIAKHFMASLPDGNETVISDMDKAVQVLDSLCLEMDNRYNLLKISGCRNIKEYNEIYSSGQLKPEDGHRFMPYIILIIDEFSDLMLTSGKDAEILLCRLAQLARAVGIHAIIATNRLTTGMITGSIKANFPTRIAFRVADELNPKLVIDHAGAQLLGGPGDLLYFYRHNEIERLQAPLTDIDAINRIVNHIAGQPANAPYVLPKVKQRENQMDLDCDSWLDEITDEIFEDDDCYVTDFSDEERAQLMKTLRQSMNDLDVIRKRFNKIMDKLK